LEIISVLKCGEETKLIRFELTRVRRNIREFISNTLVADALQ